VQGELAALSDARPRNLYLLGLFVADHQLPDCDALPAALEPEIVPEPVDAAEPTAVPVPAHLPEPSSCVGAASAGTAAGNLPVSPEKPAAASTAMPTAEQATACPTGASVPSAHDSAVDGTTGGAGAGLSLLTYLPSDTSMAAADVKQPTSAAAAQPAGGVAEAGAAQPGPAADGPLPSPSALPSTRPLSADHKPQVPDSTAPVPAAVPDAERAAAAHPAQGASPAGRPDHSTPEGGAALAPPEQTQDNATARQMTRWGAEAPSPLRPKHSWTVDSLVNNAATEAPVFSIRPAQHGALSGLEAALAPAPATQLPAAVPAADTPAQPPGGKSEAAAPSDDAVPPGGMVQASVPATTAEDTWQAAAGTAPMESEQHSGSEAALAREKASVRSAGDAAAAKAATVRVPARATAFEECTEPALEKPRRRSKHKRAARNSRSRDGSRTRQPSDGHTDELGQQPSEQRESVSRSRRSPGRHRDRSRTRRRSTEEQKGNRKRPRSRSRSSDRQQRRRSRDSGEDRRERGRRRDDSRRRQVRSSSRPDPSDMRHSSDPWGPSAAPAASMANVLMLTTEPEERAELMASVLGQVQQSDTQRPAPHSAAGGEEGGGSALPPPSDSPLLSQELPAQAEGDQDAAAAPEAVEIPAAETASRVQDVVGKTEAAGTHMPAAEDAEAQPPLSLGGDAAAGIRTEAAPAADAASFLESAGSPHAHAVHCGSAESGEPGIFGGQTVGAGESQHPAKLDGSQRKRRWDIVERPGRQDDGGQAKRQRTGSGSNTRRQNGVPAEWRHLEPQPSYDMFSGLSQPPLPQPASEKPRPPSESPPPLPVESPPVGMPSPDDRSPPRCGDHTGWCAVEDEPPLPSASPPPRSSAVGVEQPRVSRGGSPPEDLLQPPGKLLSQGQRPSKRTTLQDEHPKGPGSPQHASNASSQSAPRSPSPAWWRRAARSPSQPDSPSCSLRSRASSPTPARPYLATEWARALLATGINPLKWHLRASMEFIRSIRTKLCPAGLGCEAWLTTCAYAHAPRDLLTPDDNMLLVEVAREWESDGIPAEWKHVVKRPAALYSSLPAARTTEVAQGRSKDINPMAPPPPRSRDVNPMAPQATALQLDGEPSPTEVQPQQLPPSMLNEDVEIEESLMRLITVRCVPSSVAGHEFRRIVQCSRVLCSYRRTSGETTVAMKSQTLTQHRFPGT